MKQDSVIRKCIVTGQMLEKDFLLRFTVLPDGRLIPDFKKKLEGVGIYVTANRNILSEAVAKDVFSKMLKRSVIVDPKLVEMTEMMLKKHGLEMISLSRKAGILRTGFEKVSDLIRKQNAAFVLEAVGARSDGHKHIVAMARDLKIFNIYTVEELDQALDKCNTVHVAFEKGEMASSLVREFNKINQFINSIQLKKNTEKNL